MLHPLNSKPRPDMRRVRGAKPHQAERVRTSTRAISIPAPSPVLTRTTVPPVNGWESPVSRDGGAVGLAIFHETAALACPLAPLFLIAANVAAIGQDVPRRSADPAGING